ncbi:hypothetical protein [Syntrophomonas wolfei]|uniref:hypothetical protein n=2 Tax=Syntrophomonas wolfei TaxID=863 RepID=UPI001A995343|nr:hypothetical protein [Syntrophomonas wolfei]
MKNSTYRQPPTLDSPARIAKPYRFINGTYTEASFTALAAIIIMLIIISSLIYWIIIKILRLFKRGKSKSCGLSAVAPWVGICTSITILILFASLFSSGIDPVYQLPKEAYMPVEGNPLLDFTPILMWLFSGLLVPFTLIAWWKDTNGGRFRDFDGV